MATQHAMKHSAQASCAWKSIAYSNLRLLCNMDGWSKPKTAPNLALDNCATVLFRNPIHIVHAYCVLTLSAATNEFLHKYIFLNLPLQLSFSHATSLQSSLLQRALY